MRDLLLPIIAGVALAIAAARILTILILEVLSAARSGHSSHDPRSNPMNIREARSEVFLRLDIQSILRAIAIANSGQQRILASADVVLHPSVSNAYLAGFHDALEATALAFHVILQDPEDDRLGLPERLPARLAPGSRD